MAFIREYAAMSGDPFSLRIPKKLRKMKIGRGLAKLAPFASLIPGVGPLAGGLLTGLTSRVAAARKRFPIVQAVADQFGMDEDTVLDFARSYGLDMGDTANKRKAAGSGPKAKAAKKAQARATPHKVAKPSHGHQGRLQQAAAATGEIIHKATGGDPAGAMLAMLKGGLSPVPPLPGIAGAMRAHGFGGHRRSMNPANVKALRRSLRRVEGFETLVKRIEKAYPRLRRHSSAGGGGGRRGHKSGCRCVACRGR
jgi:hypothetical protein